MTGILRHTNNLAVAAVLILVLSLLSCSPQRRVQPPNKLLDENVVVQKGSKLNAEKIEGIIKQRPNVYTLTKFRIRLRLYNMANPKRIARVSSRLEEKVEKKNEKICEKNEKRIAEAEKKIAAGEEVEKIKIKDPKERRRTFGELLRSAGEAPVILDTNKVRRSNDQIKLYFFKKGYFDARVKDSIVEGANLKKLRRKHKKKARLKKNNKDTTSIQKKIDKYHSKPKNQNRATVYYVIKAGPASKITCYKHEIEKNDHGEIHKFINQLQGSSLIKEGARFDMDLLDKERTRLSKALRDSGFHFFNKEYIYFEYDTTEVRNGVDLYMGVHNIKTKDQFADTIILKPHQRYTVDQIEVITNYDPALKDAEYSTLSYNNLDYLYRKELRYKPQMLDKRIKYRPGQYYNHSRVEESFKKLSGLGVFKVVHVNFKADTTGGKKNSLKSIIQLEPAKPKTFSTESDGTNRDGLLGIEGSLSYTHKNVFRRAVKFETSLSGGIEAQRSIVDTEEGTSSGDIAGIVTTFNTLEYGINTSLTAPSYWFPGMNKIFPHHVNPHSSFEASFNHQRRPDFTRDVFRFAGATIINERRGHLWRVDWPEVSLVDIRNESDAFVSRITDLNDRLLAASYQDHIISALRVSYEYNGQQIGKLKNNVYFKTSVEQAGNIFRPLAEGGTLPLKSDSMDRFLIDKIPFAQYWKFTGDLRYYFNFKSGQIVLRAFGGYGIPGKNFPEALPFEKAFYTGGANGVRAWKARTLGPGTFLDSARAFDKTGDIMFEGNLEVRFEMIDWIEGALFADVGNVWLKSADSLRPGGEFIWKPGIIKELALGAGFGIRMDLDFFIIRLDLAFPIHNPALGENRFIFGNYNDLREFYRPQFVLGIGYPF